MREANVLAISVALATVATVASAKTLLLPLNSIIYDCRVNGSHSLYWIPSQLIFAYNSSTRRVQVLNPLVMRYIGHLISGAFSKDSAAASCSNGGLSRWTAGMATSRSAIGRRLATTGTR